MPTLVDLGNGVTVDLDRQLLELERADLEDSLYLFLRTAWTHIDPAPWTDGWPVEAVAEHLQAVVDGEIKRLIVNIPPRMGKSSLTAVALPAWAWAQSKRSSTSGPGAQFLFASYADRLSTRDSVKCRRLIKSHWYQKRWGHRFALTADQDAKTRFNNDKGGERLITSIGAGVTGEGGNVIVIDDPNATNESESEAMITEVMDWWDQTMSTRLNDRKTGAFILIQQRTAESDLTGHILEKNVGDWCHLCLPNRYEPDRSFVTPIGWKDPRSEPGELLWPDRLDEEGTRELEMTLGPWGSAGQLQQRPEPRGGGIVKREWWQPWPDAAFPPMDYIIGYLDTAYTEKQENDPSAMTVWGVFSQDPVAQNRRILGPDGRPVYAERSFMQPAPKVMLMNAWREHLEFHALVQKAADTCKTMKIDLLVIENKAAGISVAQELRRLFSHEPWGVFLDDPKSLDKVARLHAVVPFFAPEMQMHNGQMVPIPGGREGIVHAPDRVWADMVINEVGSFPKGKYRDLTDTVSGALNYLRKTGIIILAPERLADIDAAMQHVRAPEPLYPG